MREPSTSSELNVEDYLRCSDLTMIKFVQAANFTKTKIGNGLKVDLVVIHDMEGAETAEKAENVAQWFAGLNPVYRAPRASAHYAIDCNSIVQMVEERDIAWHAPGANHNGIGIEHAGKAKQTTLEWMDAFSKPMLLISAGLTARICKRHSIPIQLVDREGLLAKQRGITTHQAVSLAFKKSTHTDPGKNFPMAWYLNQVQVAFALL